MDDLVLGHACFIIHQTEALRAIAQPYKLISQISQGVGVENRSRLIHLQHFLGEVVLRLQRSEPRPIEGIPLRCPLLAQRLRSLVIRILVIEMKACSKHQSKHFHISSVVRVGRVLTETLNVPQSIVGCREKVLIETAQYAALNLPKDRR